MNEADNKWKQSLSSNILSNLKMLAYLRGSTAKKQNKTEKKKTYQ